MGRQTRFQTTSESALLNLNPVALYPSGLRDQHRGGNNGEVLPLSGLAKCSSYRHVNYMKEFCLRLSSPFVGMQMGLTRDADGVDPEQRNLESLSSSSLSLPTYV